MEYPPLALAPSVAAHALGRGPNAFQTAFEALMLASLLVVQWQAGRLAGDRGRQVAWSFVLLPAAAGAIAAERLDLFVMAFVLAGLAVLVVGGGPPTPRRSALALALLALGAAAKLFPAVVAAVALAWLWGRGARRAAVAGAAAFGVVVIVVCAPFAVASPGGFAEQFAFHSQRPLQVESTPATVARLIGGAAHPRRHRRSAPRPSTAPGPWRRAAPPPRSAACSPSSSSRPS